ncbi:hypothetical protein [Lentzea flava]|uniref:Uncharacterized protein n=1 Tax=Lentzea flava TaxID=103732 RepID=A0ABQ2USG2_9PSEU|nr:hypothetical protein [Lentzea flava]MCP2201308.1 hypothetical protein [Lentzea flava]GGU49179.1 hypothetical protein GCM10010178_47360 [Lentzea flava]
MTTPPQWGAPPPGRPPYQQQYQQQYQQPYPPQGRPPQGYPQPGHQQQPPPPQYHQPYQQQPWPGHLPPKPAPLVVLAVLNWILAAGMLVIAAFVIMSFLMSGGTLIIGILLAAVIAGFGVLNVLGAMSINHPHFPNTIASQMSGLFTGLVLMVALFRSVRRGVAELVPSMGSAVLLAVCVFSLVLATRPAVKQWIVAKHQLSLAQGHVPRNRR